MESGNPYADFLIFVVLAFFSSMIKFFVHIFKVFMHIY